MRLLCVARGELTGTQRFPQEAADVLGHDVDVGTRLERFPRDRALSGVEAALHGDAGGLDGLGVHLRDERGLVEAGRAHLDDAVAHGAGRQW